MLKLYSFILVLYFIFFASANVIPTLYEKSPEEGDLFEGDIAGIERDSKGAAQIPTKSRELWSYGIVPYEIDPIFTQANKDVILSGLKLVEDSTRINGRDCIKFVPRTVEPIYIRVINDSGCWSYVGKQKANGVQPLSLRAPGCMSNAVVAHEFLHALGFWHEQSRPDRDDYIKVLFENISEGTEHNFDKYTTNDVDYLKQPYDYDSVMHYGPKSFSKNGLETIVPKNPSAVIGQRKYLSPIDIAEIRTYYGCK